jgi:hypothetical protein
VKFEVEKNINYGNPLDPLGSFAERRPQTEEEKRKRSRNSDFGGVTDDPRKRRRSKLQYYGVETSTKNSEEDW